jgi:polar amino acid transport system substrate-binding protein
MRLDHLRQCRCAAAARVRKWLPTVLLVAIMTVLSAPRGMAAECGRTHVTVQGETLRDLAARYYGWERQWTVIYYVNQGALGHDPSHVQAGTPLIIPCLERQGPADPTPLQREGAAELNLLTGSDYAPFTDRDWPGQGLVTELVNAALEVSPAPVTFSLTWVDDWSRHLHPLLSEKQYDMGFPWLRPDCARNPGDDRCRNFHFSQPLFEMLVQLFVRADSDMRFASDADIEGRTLCRPAGYFTHDLDRADRRWLSEDRMTLVQPDTPADCFRLLDAGEVDGVTINEFLGQLKVREMGLGGRIVALDRPVSIQGLHVVISKTHHRGTTFLYRFNAGLEALKASDRYNEIVTRHLSEFWAQFGDPGREEEAPPPVKDPVWLPPFPAREYTGAAIQEMLLKWTNWPPPPNSSVSGGDLNGPMPTRGFFPPIDPDVARDACQAQKRAQALLRQERFADAVPDLNQAAGAGLPKASTDLGLIYLEGRTGVARDTQLAEELLRQAATGGNGRAAFLLAEAYARSDAANPSIENAIRFLLIANERVAPTDPLRAPVDEAMAAYRKTVDVERRHQQKQAADDWFRRARRTPPACEDILGDEG